jgi:microcystin degradation protein MlrC
MRILVGQFGQETNTFANAVSTFEVLAPEGWIEADRLLALYRDTPQYLGGAIRAAEEEGAELVPICSIPIIAGPIIRRDTLDMVVNRMCGEIRRHLGAFEGVYLALHGAGCAEGVDDIESYTLRAVREVIGPDMPITVSLDLHGNITPEMAALCSGMFGIKENPHVDCHMAGYLALKSLARLLSGQLCPVNTLIRLPILMTPAKGSTFDEPMRSIKEHVAAFCAERGLIDATFFHGFSAADHPFSSSSVVVVAEHAAPAEAAELARYVWRRRAELVPVTLTPDEAIDMALASVKDGYTIINEISDNPGSGCPGDGTHLLRALAARNLPRTVFQYITDPETARQAHAAGVGARIDVRVGGKTEPLHGKPLDLSNVEVLNISNGRFTYVSPVSAGLPENLGPSARLRHGNVEFVVVSKRTQALDDRALMMTGADIRDYKIVCLKSANHFRGFFQSRADAIITADPPGIRSSNLANYTFRRVTRPIYPLDMDTAFLGE